MKQIAFLSCRELVGVSDDHLLAMELEKDGSYHVTTLYWDEEADWSKFDLVIIRTTWDYAQRIEEFLEKLKIISSQTRLLNDYQVVKWNSHKSYLKELNFKTVPTEFFRYPGPIPKSGFQAEQYVIKPAISAGAYKTMVVSASDISDGLLAQKLSQGDWMLQPFLEEIKQGEISLHFFNKVYSHAIKKIPKPGDFRVQEEHGGHIESYTPTAELLKTCEDLLLSLPYQLLYARVDLVPYHQEFLLMELELIEPSLYFRSDKAAASNFKAQLHKIFTSP